MDDALLTKWFPHWSKDDAINEADRKRLMKSLSAFVRSQHEVGEEFVSSTPFRLAGYVYGHSKHSNGSTVLTTFVQSFRCIEMEKHSPTFEVITENTAYHITVRDCSKHWW